MLASVSTVVTEAWSVANYQQPGTVLVLARRKNSGSDAMKNNCIPYAVKGKGLLVINPITNKGMYMYICKKKKKKTLSHSLM